ncbi:MAG TPA: rod shape-determining protein MreD [Thermoanaerobaculia bacterium]|nr:rod shape-determining protein MreD [Thermoanaerobaculia bacterium]
MRRAVSFLVGLVLAFLGNLLLLRLSPDSSRWIDLFAVVIVLNALGSGPAGAMIGGSLAGLAEDAVAGLVYGLHGFAGTVIGFLVQQGSRLLTVQHGVMVAGIAALAVLGQEVVIAALVRVLLAESQTPEPLWVGLKAANSGVLAGVVFAASRRSAGRFALWRRSRRSRVRIDG